MQALEARASCHPRAGRYAEAAADIARAAALEDQDQDLDLALEHAILVSGTAGLVEARGPWAAFEALLEEHGGQWDAPARVAAPIISRAALGDGAGAERLVAELTATRPYWQVVDDAVLALDELAPIPGRIPPCSPPSARRSPRFARVWSPDRRRSDNGSERIRHSVREFAFSECVHPSSSR